MRTMPNPMTTLRLALLGAAALAALPAPANLLLNGSFEEPHLATGFTYVPTGTYISDHWLVTDHSEGSNEYSDLISADYAAQTFLPSAPDGGQYVYLADRLDKSAISQNVTLPDGNFTLSYLQADFENYWPGGGKLRVNVLDAASNSLLGGWQETSVPEDSPFVGRSVTFTATAGEYRVVFESVDDFCGLVDAVSLERAPVPEPASLAALGLGAMALLRRRKAA